MAQKLTTITIQVPYRSSGGVIHQHEVVFDVYRLDGHYSLRPHLELAERRLANLPEELNFVLQAGRPVSLRGKMEGNLPIIEDAVKVLKKQNQLEKEEGEG